MRKHLIGLSVAILTCCIGSTAAYIAKWATKTIIISSAARLSIRPYSTLEYNTVRIHPYNATFEIPPMWLMPDPAPEPSKNLYLSRQELTALHWDDGPDAEDAQVIDAVLPYDSCAAHMGDRGWGNYFWNDLQARVYVLDMTPEQVSQMVQTRGLDESLNVFEDATWTWERSGVWKRDRLRIMDAPTHFILIKYLDFYSRQIGNKTVVFVFLHAGGFDHTIQDMLDTFDASAWIFVP